MFDPGNFRLDGAIALVTGAGAGMMSANLDTFTGTGACGERASSNE